MRYKADSAEAFLDATQVAVGNSGAPALRLGPYEGPSTCYSSWRGRSR